MLQFVKIEKKKLMVKDVKSYVQLWSLCKERKETLKDDVTFVSFELPLSATYDGAKYTDCMTFSSMERIGYAFTLEFTRAYNVAMKFDTVVKKDKSGDDFEVIVCTISSLNNEQLEEQKKNGKATKDSIKELGTLSTPKKNQIVRPSSADNNSGNKSNNAEKTEEQNAEESAKKLLESARAKVLKSIETIAPNYASFTPDKLSSFIGEIKKLLEENF